MPQSDVERLVTLHDRKQKRLHRFPLDKDYMGNPF